MKRERAIGILFFCLLIFLIPKMFAEVNYSQDIDFLKENYAYNKKIPENYERQILLALNKYPELNKTKINFKEKPIWTTISTKPKITFIFTEEPISTTMVARPNWDFIFKKKNQIQYNIFIHDEKSEDCAVELSLENKVGIFAHELEHVVDYASMSKIQMIEFALKYKYSEKFRGNVEKRIDKNAINRGFGREIYNFTSFIYDSKCFSEGYKEYKKRIYFSPSEIKEEILKYENLKNKS